MSGSARSSSSTMKQRGKRAPASSTTATATSSSTTPYTTMPTVPTSTEILLLSIYPVTLILGSLFSLLSPETRQGLYDPGLQSFPPDVAPSYFAQKSNVFNRYFVKIGWFWVTLSFALFTLVRSIRRAQLHKAPLGTQRHGLLPPALQSVLRWALATAWWYSVTQWFFGPALIDRGFRWTGGRCHIALAKGPEEMVRNADVEDLVTAAACKAIGGAWRGGHDISGHVFLLVLGSAFLGMEILPAVLRSVGAENSGLTSTRTAQDGEKSSNDANGEAAVWWATVFAGAVGLMCLWMLLMTAAYFHTWFEKFTGLTVAFSGIASIYFLPRAILPIRAVLGAPVL